MEGTSFIADYFTELGKLGWPIDIYSGHFYPLISPENDGNPADADQLIGVFQRLIREAGGPVKPIWNTEMNYRTNPKFCVKGVACDATKSFPADYTLPALSPSDLRAIVGQTYFRSLNAGVDRLYWYAWMPKQINLGVDFTTDSAPTKASEALRSWLDNKGSPALTMSPCTIDATLAVCPINYAGVTRYAVWSTVADTTTESNFDSLVQEIVIPGKTVTSIAKLDGTVQRTGPFLVGAEPVLVDASAP